MGAAIWSASLKGIKAFPARGFIRFFVNHGLLKLSGRPQWRTVTGGSETYVQRVFAISRRSISTPPSRACTAAANTSPSRPLIGLGEALRIAAANGPFKKLIIVWLINGLANGLPAALFIMVCGQFLHDEQAQGALLLVYFLAGVLSVPFWLWLGAKWGKHRAWIASLIFTAGAFSLVPLVPHIGVWFFGPISLCTGSGLGADFSIPPAIQPDVIDLDELRSGEHQAGLFFVASTMVQKAGNALSVGIALPLLQHAGFSTHHANSALAITALVFLYCGVPSLLKLLCAVLLRGFPLDETAQYEIRAQIARATP
jgi:glycoside/pentoside/hexuronide:cation symporter, GPH family